MNNQAAITLLKGLEQSLDDYCELNDEGKTAFRMAIAALELFGNAEQLPSAQPEQQWIPCSERTPEKAYGQYWVCTDTGYQCQCRWTDNVYGLGSSGEWTWKIFDIPQYSHVVSWMPLPEAYKERREE